MATIPKPHKDKPHGARIMPRPTAASAARAARNAMNRNLNTMDYKLSPCRSRSALSPNPKGRVKSPGQRIHPQIESKSDVQLNKQQKTEDLVDKMILKPNQEETFGISDDVLNAGSPEATEGLPTASVEQDKFETLTNDTFDIYSQDSMQHDEKLKNIDTIQIQPDDISDFNISSVPVSPLKSRPETPMNSHLETLKGKPAYPSRPTTPASRGSSRPTTPASVTRRSAVSSRPSTPQKPAVSHPRVSTPQSSIPVATPALRSQPQGQGSPGCPPVLEEEDIKTVFNTKQREFLRLKKELDVKQQTLLEVFDNLRNLNDRLVKEGVGSGEGFQGQELVVFNVGDWTADEIARLCRDAASPNSENAIDFINTLNQIDENTFNELEGQVSSVPSKFADLCIQAFTARQELIDWVKELIAPIEDGRGESIERITRYNDEGLELCEKLRTLKACSDEVVDTVVQISRCALRERVALLSVGESLVREIARLRQDLEARSVIIQEMREIRAENETAKALLEARRQLEEERAAKAATKDKLSTAESQLRQTRARVSKMDRQLREAEASIVSLTSTVKTLEDQSRQREVHLEARARKLKESLKTGEVTNNNISQQRDALQAEVKILKEQNEKINAQHKMNVNELIKEIKEFKASLEDQCQQNEKEIEKNNNLEKMLTEYKMTIEELKAKIPDPNENNPELPTEREIDLWAELQATKETLRMTENEVTACKREKVRFLETLTKISESDNKVGMQQKLAAELLSKEEIISKMLTQTRELTKNIKLNEQKVIQYEQYVRDLQAHKRAAANCQEAPEGISYQDLQQEIMNLKMQLLDAVHRNEELSEVLSQKEQQLEQQDKTSRAQARIIKVREELINMLKNKETEQSKELGIMQQDLEHRMKVVEEVNKQIAAKAEEIQELFATLENKQQQIHRLEKIVLALEEQQRRAQAQRTRHEEKIAALEHELAATNRRERKFLFF